MWKEVGTSSSYGNANANGGDVEMVATTSADEYSDEDDDGVGYTMTGGDAQKRRRPKSNARVLCCSALALFTIVGLVLTYVYVPDFGLLTGGAGGASDGEDDNDFNLHTEVMAENIIDNDAYHVILKVPVPTVEGDLVLYQHKTTKTPVMTILPYDTNQDSVFGISFRTKPNNSHGAPHVLEHSVLSGSKKYPIKDPFTQLAKGSLNTFVNAMTFDDMTAYICASRNEADMKNLMSVYLDAVFAPLVIEPDGKWIFRQEGWRVEMNATGEPEFNGVVLSEMKGATSNPEEILAEYSKATLFANTSYQYNSGGEPTVIPNLNHRELQQFYKTYYHPSNAQVFLYGTKASASNCLTNLDEYLATFEAKPEIREESKIELQSPLDIQPKFQSIPYISDDADASHSLMMSWLVSGAQGKMDDEFQKQNRVLYSVLDQLLLNDKTGVLYRKLQDSGLVGRIDGGIEKGLQQWTLDIQVNNVNATDISKVQELIQSTLTEIVSGKGFDKQDIEAAMNTVQFNNRDISSWTYPRGIMLWMSVMETWKFDLQPLTGFLSFEQDFDDLEQRVKKQGSKLFTQIIQDNVLNNPHSVIIDLYPDTQLAQKNANEEQERLIKLRRSQSFPGLLDEADDLSEKQVTEDPPELIAKIPSVTVADLDKKGYEPPILIDEDRDGSGVTVLVHEVESSFGIVYGDLGVDLSELDFEDVVLLPLLARLMVDAGTSKYNDVQIAREVGRNTGGIYEQIVIVPILPPTNATTTTTSTTSRYQVPDGDHFHSKLFLRGAASKEKGDKLLELLSQMMFHAKLDDDTQERALGILRERIADLEQQLTAGGTNLARSRLHARYNTFKLVEETYRGVSVLPKLRMLLSAAENNWSVVLERLQKMQQVIIKSNRRGMVLNLTGEKAVLKHVTPRVTHFLANQLPGRSQEASSLPNFVTQPHPWVTPAKQAMAQESPIKNEGVVIGAKVNFVGAGAPFFEPLEEIPGSSEVVTQYVEYNNFMLQIRERRGAYGAYATTDKWTGLLLFMTYRDPNLLETLEVYRAVPNYLKEQMEDDPSKAQALINSAIIGSIGSLDGAAPQPNTAGWISLMQWYQGSTPKHRQTWRHEILSTSIQDFLDYAERLESWQPTLAIAGPKSLLDKKEKSLDLTMIDLL